MSLQDILRSRLQEHTDTLQQIAARVQRCEGERTAAEERLRRQSSSISSLRVKEDQQRDARSTVEGELRTIRLDLEALEKSRAEMVESLIHKQEELGQQERLLKAFTEEAREAQLKVRKYREEFELASQRLAEVEKERERFSERRRELSIVALDEYQTALARRLEEFFCERPG